MAAPASTGRATPVTYCASSETSHSNALLMSSGCSHGTGSRFSGVRACERLRGRGFQVGPEALEPGRAEDHFGGNRSRMNGVDPDGMRRQLDGQCGLCHSNPRWSW
jgi:hypothetical protein